MKLLASDLDGTLYFGNEEVKIKPQDRAAIQSFQQAGNLFGICSGRTLFGIQRALSDLDIQLDFYILVSGACIADKDGHILFQRKLSKPLLHQMIASLKGYACSMMMCESSHYFHFQNEIAGFSYGTDVQDMSELPFDSFDSFHLAFKEIAELEKVKALLTQQFSDKIAVHHNVLNLDITPQGCSKGNAIKMLDQYLPVRFSDIAVIGDSYNDISMLKAAKTSFTFHRSDTLVQTSATHLVDDISQAIKILEEI